MKDLFGQALLDFQNGNYSEDLITSTNISDEDILALPYLFRDYNEMPELERIALRMAKGSVLDVGCGAGSHSLYLQNNGIQVKGIDISKGAVRVCSLRGLNQVEHKHILEETQTYDTILLLMNGTGIFQTMQNTIPYLRHLKSLLQVNGQILIDSSDIKYMFEGSNDKFWKDNSSNYYGELEYYLSYKNNKEVAMKWLYLDFKTLFDSCHSVGLHCSLVEEGEHYDYLARLTIKD